MNKAQGGVIKLVSRTWWGTHVAPELVGYSSWAAAGCSYYQAYSSQDCTNWASKCSPAAMRVREKWVQEQPVALVFLTVLRR